MQNYYNEYWNKSNIQNMNNSHPDLKTVQYVNMSRNRVLSVFIKGN